MMKLRRQQQFPESREDQIIWWDLIQGLSTVTKVEELSQLVTHMARQIANADGTTFVLKENDKCYYFDEYAISELWKGQKFPANSCLSGWSMINKQIAIIPNIYLDNRVPHDVYRPTFVKSVCMVPVRKEDPIAAIGCYWQNETTPTVEQLESLQILADTCAVVFHNIQLKNDLKNELAENATLSVQNRDLEVYLYSLVHDLRNPLAILSGISSILNRSVVSDNKMVVNSLKNMTKTVNQMALQIDKMLALYRVSNSALQKCDVNVSEMAFDISESMKLAYPIPQAEVSIEKNMMAHADVLLLKIILENLFSNAFKYSTKEKLRKISFQMHEETQQERIFVVTDNGIGFDNEKAENLFKPLVRLHAAKDFSGTGLGLSSVAKIIQVHGGRIWAHASENQGSQFYFSLPHKS